MRMPVKSNNFKQKRRAEDYSMTDLFMLNCVAKWYDNLAPSKPRSPHSWISIRTSFQWHCRIGINIETSLLRAMPPQEADRHCRRNILQEMQGIIRIRCSAQTLGWIDCRYHIFITITGHQRPTIILKPIHIIIEASYSTRLVFG